MARGGESLNGFVDLGCTIRGELEFETYFRVDGSALPAMERKCQLSDSIMRVLFLKVDPRIVEPLVEHAMAGVHGKSAEEKKPAEPPKPAEATEAVAEGDAAVAEATDATDA